MMAKGNGGTVHEESSGELILIVEDNLSDVHFLKRALRQAGVMNPTKALDGGAAAIEYLTNAGVFADRAEFPFPRVVFLDLKMPPPDGLAVLAWKETQTHLPKILWVVVSVLDSDSRIKEAYEAGASTFLAKPVSTQDLANVIQKFSEFWVPQKPCAND